MASFSLLKQSILLKIVRYHCSKLRLTLNQFDNFVQVTFKQVMLPFGASFECNFMTHLRRLSFHALPIRVQVSQCCTTKTSIVCSCALRFVLITLKSNIDDDKVNKSEKCLCYLSFDYALDSIGFCLQDSDKARMQFVVEFYIFFFFEKSCTVTC